MNCCDEYGKCQRGPDCPAGQGCTKQAQRRRPPRAPMNDGMKRLVGLLCVLAAAMLLAGVMR